MSSQNPVFLPGPTNLPDRLRRAMDIQTVDHRGPNFGERFLPLLDDLKQLLGTRDGEVQLFPATGTGGWEVAVTNTLSPGDTVLAARYGTFTTRWIELCERHGLNVEVIETEWGEGEPIEAYAEALKADTQHRIKAVLSCHNETSTGVTSDLAAVRGALDTAGHPALFMVDGVSSIASIDFRMDDWGVDVALTGSQKGFMLPPGLAIVAFSQRALAANETATCPRAYFDVGDMRKANSAGTFHYTPPVGMIDGLAESVKMLREEGLQQVFARHARIAEGVRQAAAGWGLSLCAKRPELYSDTVTAIHVPEDFDSGELVRHAHLRYGVAFGAGLGKVAGKVFRIGHLGEITDVMALSGIATAEMAMADFGYPIELGSGVTAAQRYYSETSSSPKRQVA